jgi:hypothetical protein
MASAFSAEFWYRPAEDADEGLRDLPQMMAPAASEAAALAEAERLRAQGYCLQRIDLLRTCEACGGAGKISRPPKGTRRKQAASLPAWRLIWERCAFCGGEGYTERRALLLPAEEWRPTE